VSPRFDTLFVRLFLLMWAVLVISHLVAFTWVVPWSQTGHGVGMVQNVAERVLRGPAVPSLPPGSLLGSGSPAPSVSAPPEQKVRSRPALPRGMLWLDYALRALVIGLGAWLGALWLSRPMRRLTHAATELPQGLEQGRRPTPLNESRGTLEVRQTARVFNQMAERLQRQFDQRSLHMAAVSHDLRTPLTRLRLRLESLPAEVRQAAVADLREMDELIESSLQVMQEQSGGADAVPVDLGALVQSLVDDLIEQGKPVQLQSDLSELRVRAHPASLRRILDNLVGNALRYGQRAWLRVRVLEGEVQVLINDDGPGIAPEQLAQVFVPWVRLSQAARPGGNGLGLAIARDLARREGGDVSLDNRPQGGLQAILHLPVHA